MEAFHRSLADLFTLPGQQYEQFRIAWQSTGLAGQQLVPFEQTILPGKPGNTLDLLDALLEKLHRVYDQVPMNDFHAGVALHQWTVLLQDVLLLLTEQIARLSKNFKFSSADHDKARMAHDLIVKDFEQFHSVAQLAKRVGITEARLQLAFRYVYQETVAQFSRQARLQEGYRLLTATDYPLRVVCVMVGFDDPGNFCVAFKKQYGFNPGYIRKHRKLK